MSYSGTSISDRLNGVIESLDKKTETKVKAEYGEDIASKVEHISKQIENLPEGGSGGSESEDERLTIVLTKRMFAGDMEYGVTPSYLEIKQYFNTHATEEKPPLVDYYFNDGGYNLKRPFYVDINIPDDGPITFGAYTNFTPNIDVSGNRIGYIRTNVVRFILGSDNSVTCLSDPNVFIYSNSIAPRE